VPIVGVEWDDAVANALLFLRLGLLAPLLLARPPRPRVITAIAAISPKIEAIQFIPAGLARVVRLSI
jgi:hypothetical protein